MKRWKILSRFDQALSHPLPLVLGAWLILSSTRFPVTVFALTVLLYASIARDDSWLAAAVLLACFLIPTGLSSETMREGRVITVRNNYVVVSNHGSKLLVYTRAKPILDSTISFDGVSVLIEPSKGFYQFDFSSYCRLQGITCSISPDTIKEIKPTYSLRGHLMAHILNSGSPHTEELLEILFHIHSDGTFQGIFADRSFSLAGVLVFLRLLLKYFFYEADRKRILTGITIVLAIAFHFPYLLTQRLISFGLERAGFRGMKKQGLSFLIGLRLFPWVIHSASFLIPAVYTFSSSNHRKDLSERFFWGMQMESLLFYTVKPMELLAFRFLMPVTGAVWILALLEALTSIPFTSPVSFLDHCLGILNWISLPGTMLGGGLLAYGLLQLSLRNGPHCMKQRCALFLLFQITGLFHPFAELTFINVGQGDSILIRGSLGTSDILIDTGKPTQWNAVKTMLEAKGIKQLDALIITHSDNDHSGNQQNVIDTFHPKQVFTSHHDPLSIGALKLYDLNPLTSEDENESSITDYCFLNGMKVLLMGDASSDTEAAILHRYPKLSCDIVKLSHHGSHTGSSEKFLNTVRPKLGIISSGVYSIYHHPSPEVIARLNNRRIPYLDTKTEGDISIICLPFANVLLTSNGKLDIIRV